MNIFTPVYIVYNEEHIIDNPEDEDILIVHREYNSTDSSFVCMDKLRSGE